MQWPERQLTAEPLRRVLAATGYLPDGEPAAGLRLGEDARGDRRGRNFEPDALWRTQSSLTVYFKYEIVFPTDETVSMWRREIWNEGFAPLLWVVSPKRIDLYNGFGTPLKEGDAKKHLIKTFENVESSLRELDELAGRLSLETGRFWEQVTTVDRKTSVDQRLLSDLAYLERDLVAAELELGAAQSLIGRVIFAQYLVDRKIVTAAHLKKLCSHAALPPILRDRSATRKLFGWLSDTFNGDMFPASSGPGTPSGIYLSRVADFLEAVDPEDGQRSLFPYQFDVIPVELISSIYEQFVHAEHRSTSTSQDPSTDGVHYTRLSVVALVLDEVMQGLTGKETVLDLTCGSGVFLVEALRRLVHQRAEGRQPTREEIRTTLYEQVYGVDSSEAAIRVAAFSLYLAALELDPQPRPPHALKFRSLIGKTLLVGDARTIERTAAGKVALTTTNGLKAFDLIVGNPPWSFKGRAGTEARRSARQGNVPAQPRGEGLDFVLRAIEFAHKATRFGIILSAMPFFSRSGTGMAAVQYVIKQLAPVTLVSLANLCTWLFATATMPAIVLFARHRPQKASAVTIVQIPWTISGGKTHSFEVSPTDIIDLSLAEIVKEPTKLKAAAVGRRRDLVLLDAVTSTYRPLSEQFDVLGTELNVGLIRGLPKNRTRDARELMDLDFLQADDMQRFRMPSKLPKFNLSKAQWPRSRDIYRSPVVIVKETLSSGPRAIVAVAERDTVYTNAFFGASLRGSPPEIARLLSAILSSSFACWFFLMTASEFGIWKRRLLRHDIAILPIPNLVDVLRSVPGSRLIRIEQELRRQEPTEDLLKRLDRTVCDIYNLDAADRIILEDGLVRASWQWQAGREASVESVAPRDGVAAYAEAFLSVIAGWLSARGARHMRAEVLELPKQAPLRVVRFVLKDGLGDSAIVSFVKSEGELEDVLGRIGSRLKVKIATALSASRELRIHGRNEVIIIKPAARRYWLPMAGLEDADAVVAESFSGGRSENPL